MSTTRLVIASLAALLHVLFFAFESLWWMRPAVMRRFGQTDETARSTRLLAFNQGFYNLFLALGTAAGIVATLRGHAAAGEAIVLWCTISMFGAALVLVFSSPKMLRGALIQGIPPLVYLVTTAIGW